MFDWKMVIAGIAALVLVAFVIAGDTGTDFLSGTIDRIKNFLGGSPLGGLFSAKEEQQPLVLVIYPENLSLSLKENNVSMNNIRLSSFTGTVDIDFKSHTISLQQTSSQLIISSAIENIIIEDLKIPRLKTEDVELEFLSGKYNITSNNGTIEMLDFLGNVTINPISIRFEGNATKIERA